MVRIIRVLIVDDHAIVRAGIRHLLDLQSDMEVVGEAKNGQESLARVQELKPDVVVMDISMPDMSGIEATKEIKKARSQSAWPLLLAD